MLGWTAGAGADIMVTERVFGRVEYRYTDFGSETSRPARRSEVNDKNDRINFGLGVEFYRPISFSKKPGALCARLFFACLFVQSQSNVGTLNSCSGINFLLRLRKGRDVAVDR